MFMEEKMKKNVQGAVRFMKENRLFLFRLSVMGVVALSSDPALAAQSDSTFAVVTSPIEKFSNTITGPIATAIGTAGAALLGLSVSMNFENQVAKRGVQGVGGIGLGMGAATLVKTLGGGFLF